MEERLLTAQLSAVRQLVPEHRKRLGTERDDLGFH